MAPDMAALTDQVNTLLIHTIVAAIISIAGAIALLYMSRDGIRKVLGMIADADTSHRNHKRLARERKNAQYREWKKSKGY